jgi:tetratricopeptide (TPR) repeat protein
LCNEKTQPRDKAHVILGLARCKFEQGDFLDAEKLCSQALEQDDTSLKTEAMYLLVNLKEEEGKLPDAIKILENCACLGVYEMVVVGDIGVISTSAWFCHYFLDDTGFNQRFQGVVDSRSGKRDRKSIFYLV